MAYLQFISDENLIAAVGAVIGVIKNSEQRPQALLHKNVIDPFSALFDGMTRSISYEDWLMQEQARQTQKTMQNAIGDFHQRIIGSMYGWENLGFSGGLDVVNKKLKIVAEIKNKFNTTKGNHRIEIYDSLRITLKRPEYEGFSGYFVEIIPKGKNRYDKEFVPPDNKLGKRRVAREYIRVIDGLSFYYLATGRKLALQELFRAIPKVIEDHFMYKLNPQEQDKYLNLFGMAFSTE